MDGKFGYSTLPRVAYWNCTCEVVRGSPLLLAPLAAAVAGGGSLQAARIANALFSHRVRSYSSRAL